MSAIGARRRQLNKIYAISKYQHLKILGDQTINSSLQHFLYEFTLKNFNFRTTIQMAGVRTRLGRNTDAMPKNGQLSQIMRTIT